MPTRQNHTHRMLSAVASLPTWEGDGGLRGWKTDKSVS